jgi:hypothetical protein
MTQTPNRDIDFGLTYGVNLSAISTLGINNPASSDHLGICFDIDMEAFFHGSCSDVFTNKPRGLSSGHSPSVFAYIQYVEKQITRPRLWKRTMELYDIASIPPKDFTADHIHQLNAIDSQLTGILLASEHSCSHRNINRQPRSPVLQETALYFSYWKQKFQMAQKKLFRWEHI